MTKHKWKYSNDVYELFDYLDPANYIASNKLLKYFMCACVSTVTAYLQAHSLNLLKHEIAYIDRSLYPIRLIPDCLVKARQAAEREIHYLQSKGYSVKLNTNKKSKLQYGQRAALHAGRAVLAIQSASPVDCIGQLCYCAEQIARVKKVGGHNIRHVVNNKKAIYADILRDIINPYDDEPTIVLQSSEMRDTAVNIVRNMYMTDDFYGTAILADALEDVGYTNQIDLNHLRDNREHHRGCYVLEKVLNLQ